MSATARNYYNVIFIGETQVGKSTLFERIMGQKPSFGIDSIIQRFPVGNDQQVAMRVTDISGEDRFDDINGGLSAIGYKNADTAVLTFDLSNPASFKKLEFYIQKARRFSNNPDLNFVLVGTKSDLPPTVTLAHIEAFKAQHKIQDYFVTSTHKAKGLEELKQGVQGLAPMRTQNPRPPTFEEGKSAIERKSQAADKKLRDHVAALEQAERETEQEEGTRQHTSLKQDAQTDMEDGPIVSPSPVSLNSPQRHRLSSTDSSAEGDSPVRAQPKEQGPFLKVPLDYPPVDLKKQRLIKLLEAYMTRIEIIIGNSNSYAKGLTFALQAANRKANYLLAVDLRDKLQNTEQPASIAQLFSKKALHESRESIRADETKFTEAEKSHWFGHSIRSRELNAIIEEAQAMKDMGAVPEF